MADGSPPVTRVLQLPLTMADFSRRGFRLDRESERAELEKHARYFLTGFNVAAKSRYVHSALAEIPDAERGFAYEGAGMFAALHDLAALGRGGALARLLSGPGDDYTHLIHVGHGWALVPTRLPLPVAVPATPLLRWLALDGAGFAETYFGGLRALWRRCHRRPSEHRQARIAGCGRALWFTQAADPVGVARVIARMPESARGPLWSGIGLAACYAGCAGPGAVAELVRSSGPYAPHFGQGVLFAGAARYRARIVPEHTGRVCEQLFSATPEEISWWTDEAAHGLTGSTELSAYTEWKARLRELAERRF
nr:DUF1702 family protein [Amycolatopsis coloradensis]